MNRLTNSSGLSSLYHTFFPFKQNLICWVTLMLISSSPGTFTQLLTFIDDHSLHQLLGWGKLFKGKSDHHFSSVILYSYIINSRALGIPSKSLQGLLTLQTVFSPLLTPCILSKMVFFQFLCLENSHILFPHLEH